MDSHLLIGKVVDGKDISRDGWPSEARNRKHRHDTGSFPSPVEGDLKPPCDGPPKASSDPSLDEAGGLIRECATNDAGEQIDGN